MGGPRVASSTLLQDPGRISSTAMRMSSCATAHWTLEITLMLRRAGNSAGANSEDPSGGRFERTTRSSSETTRDFARARASPRWPTSLRRRSATDYFAQSHNQACARHTRLPALSIRTRRLESTRRFYLSSAFGDSQTLNSWVTETRENTSLTLVALYPRTS